MASRSEIPDISDESVRKATGRSWDEWFVFLDARGASGRSHKELVALVAVEGRVLSRWWQQAVANGYEKLSGRRALGETLGAGFQIGVQKTMPLERGDLWALALSPAGIAVWLGEGAPRRLSVGEEYELADGARGAVRVLSENSHVRLTWQPRSWPRASTIQVRVSERSAGKALLAFHQEHLPNATAREERRAWFREASRRLSGML